MESGMNSRQQIWWLMLLLGIGLFCSGCPDPSLHPSRDLWLSRLTPGSLQKNKTFEQLGPSAVPTLLQVLHHKNHALRSSAISALSRYPDQSNQILPALLKTAAVDKDCFVRSAAIGALGKFGQQKPARVVPGLVKALQDKTEVVQLHALDALRKLGHQAADAGPALLLYLQEHPDQRTETLKTLNSLGKAAIPVFLEALQHPTARVRAAAAAGLGRFSTSTPQTRRSLFHALQDSTELVRHSAALALIRRSSESLPKSLQRATHLSQLYKWITKQERKHWQWKEAAGLMLQATRNRNRRLAAFARFLLRELELRPRKTAEELRRWLGHPSRPLRLMAILSFHLLGPHGSSAIPMLTRIVAQSDPLSREYALRVLRTQGSLAMQSLPVIVRQLTHKSPAIRVAALEAVDRLSPGIEWLKKFVQPRLSDPKRTVRCQAAWLIARRRQRMTPKGRRRIADFLHKQRCYDVLKARSTRWLPSKARPVRVLLRELNDKSTLLRRQALRELLQHAGRKALQTCSQTSLHKALHKTLKDRDWRVRSLTARVLGGLKDSPRVHFALYKALQDSHWRVRFQAARTLLWLHTDAASPASDSQD
jgi:HEAT repeat protein